MDRPRAIRIPDIELQTFPNGKPEGPDNPNPATLKQQEEKKVAKNEHTGASIKTGANSQAYRDGWERIFGNKKS